MKVSEMIRNLQYLMEENGDLDCYYAVYGEVNEYGIINDFPSVCYVNNYGNVCLYKDKDFKPICVVN